MSMNQIFAEYYNTLGNDEGTKTASATQEDLTKQAQYELFAKVASANGINLSQLSDAQCDELFERTMGPEKTAGEMGKREMAEREHAEKRAAAVMFEQADSFGRQAAHAYVDELKKVAAAVEEQQYKEATVGETARAVGGHIAGAARSAGGHAADAARSAGGHAADAARSAGGWAKEHPKTTAGVAAGTVAAAAGAEALRRHRNKSKEEAAPSEEKTSAIDELAAYRALAIVDEYNKTAGVQPFDLNVADERIAAVVFTLGLGDSTKIASAANVDTAIEIRALEALEAAGYPVQWPA